MRWPIEASHSPIQADDARRTALHRQFTREQLIYPIAPLAHVREGGLRARPVAPPSRQGSNVEPISKSFEEDDEAGKLDKAEEIVGVVLPANEDPALPLNPGEEALDEPASHVAA